MPRLCLLAFGSGGVAVFLLAGLKPEVVEWAIYDMRGVQV